MTVTKRMKKKCFICKEIFNPGEYTDRYCSDECSKKLRGSIWKT